MMDHLYYGCAYYDEYMPFDRLEKDIQMMKDANINVIRIAESTWATEEPRCGEFDFSHVERVLKATEKAGIQVIIGTPTYAIPPWLAAMHPEVMADTHRGKNPYGARQLMDITSPIYRYYAERVIRKLMEVMQPYSHVIGVQLDNETKHYDTCGPHVQKRFVAYLREKFGTVDALNRAYNLHYWSNAIDAWENFPDVRYTINGSLAAEFEKFQRSLVDEYLSWQADIVRPYLKPDQFITHNFDFEWRGFSFGVQPDVSHDKASRCLTVAGCDIYHPTQDHLTGHEIAFGGDVVRSIKNGQNYLVLETEAQGFPQWVPYPGQLRLQAFSHLASGAASVMYWHWHSIHNSFETYWKGLLSHDFLPNEVYKEAATVGADFKRLSPHLTGLQKKNRAAVLVSNEALSAMKQFPLPDGKTGYNDVVRWLYDTLFSLNVETDILFPSMADKLASYDLVMVPALYAASESLLQKLSDYVAEGGCLLASFKTGFAMEDATVYPDQPPHGLTSCLGIGYSLFTVPENVGLTGDDFSLSDEERKASVWMELVTPTTAQVIAHYDHPYWHKYAAITRNTFEKGTAYYMATMTSSAYARQVLSLVLQDAGLLGPEQSLPCTLKKGVNALGHTVRFYLNYSQQPVSVSYTYGAGKELISETAVTPGQTLELAPWGFAVVEENA